jgi:hypothetical protein
MILAATGTTAAVIMSVRPGATAMRAAEIMAARPKTTTTSRPHTAVAMIIAPQVARRTAIPLKRSMSQARTVIITLASPRQKLRKALRRK